LPQFDRGIVSAGEPPWTIPGEAYISLDRDARLRRVYVVPPEQAITPPGGAEPVTPYDFEPLFEFAGLDMTAFQEVAPRYAWNYAVDDRRAWLGTYPESPGIPLLVEAGTLNGALAYFRFLPPWEDPFAEADAPAPEADAAEASRQTAWQAARQFIRAYLSPILGLTFVALLIGAVEMARRNLRSGRGDLDGAFRMDVDWSGGRVCPPEPMP